MLGDFLPTRIAMENPEETLIQCQKHLRRLIFITKPAVSLLSNSARILLVTLGMNTRIDDTVTEDEVKDLIEQATEDGTFEKKEQNLVDRVFHMGDQTAYSLMTPRTQMLWIDLEDSLEQNLALIRATSEAIIPVGKESLDNFCGVIYIKDIFNAALDNKPLDLAQFIRKPVYIPRSMESFRILEKFQVTGIHEAAVLDEYGGVIGFITLQDILLELIGETNNVNEPESAQITSREDNAWNIEGLCSIDDFKEKFGIEELPEEERYDGYLQLENGVGMLRLLTEEFQDAFAELKITKGVQIPERELSIATGRLAYRFIDDMAKQLMEQYPQLKIHIYPIRNDFFGEMITVSGLLTGQDLLAQLKGQALGEKLLLPQNVLKSGEAVFLDDMTLTELEKALQVPIDIVKSSGQDFLDAIIF